MKLHCVVIAGGSGERFWPFSTAEKPKQFLGLFGGGSLLRRTYARLSPLVPAERFYVVTTKDLVRATKRELPELPAGNVAGEPMRRNTCAAVALGVAFTGCSDDDVVAFFPADHIIGREPLFRAAVKRAVRTACRRDAVVTLGVKPSHPSDQYGYIDPATGLFVEKPSARKAAKLVSAGYLWNAGMFIARAGVFKAAFARHAPGFSFSDTRRLASKYRSLPSVQFDRAVMEPLSAEGKVAVEAVDIGWDDVGSYAALERHFAADSNGNILIGDVTAEDSSSVSVVASGKAKVAVLGLRNVVVAVSGSNVLVMDKSRASDIRKIVR